MQGFDGFDFPQPTVEKWDLPRHHPKQHSYILVGSFACLENTMKFPKWDPRSQTPFPLKLAATQHLFDGNPGKLPELLGI